MMATEHTALDFARTIDTENRYAAIEFLRGFGGSDNVRGQISLEYRETPRFVLSVKDKSGNIYNNAFSLSKSSIDSGMSWILKTCREIGPLNVAGIYTSPSLVVGPLKKNKRVNKKNAKFGLMYVIDVDTSDGIHNAVGVKYASRDFMLDKIDTFKHIPSAVYDTGGGYQLHYYLQDAFALRGNREHYEARGKGLFLAWEDHVGAENKGSSDNLTGVSALIRLPGTKNCKDPAHIKSVRLVPGSLSGEKYLIHDFPLPLDYKPPALAPARESSVERNKLPDFEEAVSTLLAPAEPCNSICKVLPDDIAFFTESKMYRWFFVDPDRWFGPESGGKRATLDYDEEFHRDERGRPTTGGLPSEKPVRSPFAFVKESKDGVEKEINILKLHSRTENNIVYNCDSEGIPIVDPKHTCFKSLSEKHNPHNYKYIKLNFKVAQIIHADIDSKELIGSLGDIYSPECWERTLGVKTPNILLETDKGYNLFWLLKDPIVMTNKTRDAVSKPIRFAQDVRAKIQIQLGADLGVPFTGYTRNPLYDRAMYALLTTHEYDLRELNLPDVRLSSVNFSQVPYEEGKTYRSIFNFAVNFVLSNRGCSIEELESATFEMVEASSYAYVTRSKHTIKQQLVHIHRGNWFRFRPKATGETTKRGLRRIITADLHGPKNQEAFKAALKEQRGAEALRTNEDQKRTTDRRLGEAMTKLRGEGTSLSRPKIAKASGLSERTVTARLKGLDLSHPTRFEAM